MVGCANGGTGHRRESSRQPCTATSRLPAPPHPQPSARYSHPFAPCRPPIPSTPTLTLPTHKPPTYSCLRTDKGTLFTNNSTLLISVTKQSALLFLRLVVTFEFNYFKIKQNKSLSEHKNKQHNTTQHNTARQFTAGWYTNKQTRTLRYTITRLVPLIGCYWPARCTPDQTRTQSSGCLPACLPD